MKKLKVFVSLDTYVIKSQTKESLLVSTAVIDDFFRSEPKRDRRKETRSNMFLSAEKLQEERPQPQRSIWFQSQVRTATQISCTEADK